jgi:ribosomal protein L30/L7E
MRSIYNSNVLLDDYAGLNRGWNDPDMLEVGNTRSTTSSFLPANFKENESHFNMWAIMNSPLLLGNDLRQVEYGDLVWEVITNEDIIALNQDPLGVQAKRVKIDMFSGANADPRVYNSTIDRIDYLVKPCANGDLALLTVNLSDQTTTRKSSITINELINGDSVNGIGIGAKMVNKSAFENAKYFIVSDLGAHRRNSCVIAKDTPITADLLGHQSQTVRISQVTDFTVSIVQNPQADDTVAVDYTIIDPGADSIKVKLILAVYNENGSLFDFKIDEVNETGQVYSTTLTTGRVAPLMTVKAFIWNESFIPLSPAKIFTKPASDKTELAKQISVAEAFDPARYTQASFANLLLALSAARSVNEEHNPYQSSVDSAAAALAASISGLVVLPRIVLGELIARANAYNPALYEPDSYAVLAAGIVEAKAVYDNALANDVEIEAAIAALQAAINGLKMPIDFSTKVQIRNAYRTTMYIEGYSGASGVGGRIDVWTAQTSDYDKWLLKPDSTQTYFQIAKVVNNSSPVTATNVLAPTGGTVVAGTQLTLAAPSATSDNQWWRLERQASGAYIISNKANPNLVVAIIGDSTTNGTYLHLAVRDAQPSQVWTFPPLLVP